MKLLVGLGNPGRKYEGTRHNVGFEVIAELARRLDVGRPKAKFDGEFAETTIQSEKVFLLCPLTYMNLSGQTVGAAIDFYKMSQDDLMVICDDLNLPLGRLRIRPSGSSGGNNGLKDIISRLGSDLFARLRLGVGRPPGQTDSANYVLGRFSKEDRILMDQTIVKAADAAELWVASGVPPVMNKYNPDPNKPKKPKTEKPEAESDDEHAGDKTEDNHKDKESG